MRLVVCLLLAAVLIQGTLAVSSKATQKKMLIEKINRTLEKSVFGRALKNMVNLATKLRYNYDDLDNAFQSLLDQLSNRRDIENDLFASQTLYHETQVDVINAAIEKYTIEVIDGELLVSQISSQLDVAESTLLNLQAQLSQAKQNLSDAQDFKSNLIAAHQKDVEDYETALSFIREAVVHLNEAQDNYENANLGEFSFVEIRNKMSTFVKNMATATANMRASHQLFIKPVIMALNQLASGAEDSSIQVAIKALNQLDDYFSKALAQAKVIFENDLAAVNERIANFEAQIEFLRDTLIPAVEAEIENYKAKLVIAEDNLAISRANLAQAQQDLEDENASYVRISQRHYAIIKKIDTEYDLVADAKNIINNARANQE